MAPSENVIRAMIAQANSALAAHSAGDLVTAEKLFRELLPRMEHPAVLSSFGALLVKTKRPLEALPILSRAVAIAKDKTGALLNLGAAYRDLGQSAAAITCLRQVLALDPANAGAFGNRGVALTDLRYFSEAERCLMHAGVLQPDNPDHAFNLGVLRREQANLPAAVGCYRRVLSLIPDHCGALDNMATALGDLGNLAEACAAGRHLLALDPNRHNSRFWYGNILIAAGHWRDGWRAYEARRLYLSSAALPSGLKVPVWDGAPMRDGTLLLYGEQGVGDVLLMTRFLSRVHERVDRVVFAVHPSLKRLLSSFAPPNTRVISLEEHPGPVDAALPIMSLIAVLALEPADIGGQPYLSADDDLRRSWRSRLPPAGTKPRVGLVWAGNPKYLHDKFRSPGFQAVKPLLSMQGVTWVILQVGYGREPLKNTRFQDNVIDLGEQVQDFADTAAILGELDLLITSDTAPAHLAGALGVPSYVIVPALLDWRWASDTNDQSRWYQSVRVVRQFTLGNWGDAVDRVRQHIIALEN